MNGNLNTISKKVPEMEEEPIGCEDDMDEMEV